MGTPRNLSKLAENTDSSGVLGIASGGTGGSTAAAAKSALNLHAVASSGSYADLNNKPTTANITEDTNLYYTDARARAAVSATGSLSYNSTTGVFSYTTPSTSGIAEGTNLYFTDARVRAAVSAGTNLSYNSTTGVFSTSLTQYTDALARAAVSAGTGLSYNSTTGVFSTSLTQYTDALARAAVSATGSLSYNSTTGVFSYTTPSTSGIDEGSNLYYTDVRARAAHSAGTGISYNSTTGAISSTITQYTDALARAAVSAGTGLSYNSSTGVFTNTITQYTDALAVSANTSAIATAKSEAIASAATDATNKANAAQAAAISAVTNGAGAAFDTLKEIQDAMATDAELAAAIASITVGNATQTIAAGTGLSGGGSFTANQTAASTVTLSLGTAGTSGTYTKVTTDAYGRVTSGTTLSSGDIPSLSGLYLPLAGGTLTGALNVGTVIGSRGTSLSISGSTNSSPFAAKSSDYATVFAVLPHSGSWTYLSTGVHYQSGVWTHASANTDSALLGLSGGSGAQWFASSNSSASWNVASSIALWDQSGTWTGSLNAATGAQVNSNVILHAGNVGSYALPISGGTLSGFFAAPSGSKITVQGSIDGGSSRGIFLWTSSDSNWGIYMAQSGAGRALNDGTAPTSIDGRAYHSVRFRAYGDDANRSFIWENNSNIALASLTTDTGNFYTRGQMYAGNSTSNLVLHTGNYNSYALPFSGGTLTGRLITTASAESDSYSGAIRVSPSSSQQWSGISFPDTNAGTSNSNNYWFYGRGTAISDRTFTVHIPDYSDYGSTGAIPSWGVYKTGANNLFRVFSNGSVTVGGNTVLNAGNYNSYSPTLTGTGASGTWGISITGNSATTSQRAFSGDISATGQGRFTGWYTGNAATGTAAEIGMSSGEGYIFVYNRDTQTYGTLNISSSGANMRFSGSTINVGSGSLQQGGNQVLHAGNYTSYSPSLTGSGASGTWSISVTGSAGSAGEIGGYRSDGSWLRKVSDATQFQMYGNTRTMIYRTDGNTNPHGGGGYAHIFYYGGSSDPDRKFIINTDGRLYSPYHGWLDTMSVAYASSAGTADQIDGWAFRNTGDNSAVNADTLESNGITYYTAGVPNFTGNATDGALYSQAYNGNWQHQIAGDYRSGQIALRGKSNGTWQSWRTVLDSSNVSTYAHTISTNPSTAGPGTLAIGNNGSYSFVQSHAGQPLNLNPVGNPVSVAGNAVLHAGNYTSYSPSLGGSGASGTWGINITGNAATASKTTANAGYARVGYGMAPFYNWGGANAGAGAPSDSTYTTGIDVGSHPSDQAYGFQIASNMWNVGLWTRTYNSGFSGWVRILDSSNYTSYSPSLTGSGASGTWGISISGSAASVGGLTPAQFFNNMGNNHSTYTNFNSVPATGAYYVQQGTNGPTGVAANQFYGFTLGLGNEYPISQYGTQLYWPRRAQNSETYVYVRDMEGSSWTSWTKIRAGFSDSTSRLYSTDSAYNFNSANPYYGYLTYDGSRWLFQVSPATPAAVRVSYADNAGNSTTTSQSTFGDLYTNSWFRNNNSNQGLYNQVTTQHWSSNANGYWDASSTTSHSGIRLYTGGHVSAIRGYVYADTSNHVGFLNQDGSWRLRVVSGDYSLADGSSMRAQIFYDSNDTAYYTDPAGGTSFKHQVLRGAWNTSPFGGGQEQFTIRTSYPSYCLRNTDTGSYWLVHHAADQTINWYGGAGGVDGSNWSRNLYLDMSGNLTARNNITAYSDIRLKTNIKLIDNPLEKVKRLRGVYFNWKETGILSVGMIAQEVELVFPELVLTSNACEPGKEDYKETKSLDYSKIVSVLVEAIKEQDQEVVDLKTRVAQLEALINKLIKD